MTGLIMNTPCYYFASPFNEKHWMRYYKLQMQNDLYLQLFSRFGAISVQEYVSKVVTHRSSTFDLVYKLRRTKVQG